ncbi:hypothetical protein FJY94_01980 [Candidatus Kaiserbacteria bacterium]|nr:hypothetical protein [Candidatus Kaiserbacteria bacterium]
MSTGREDNSGLTLEEEERWASVVKRSRELKEAGHLFSGFEFYINSTAQIDIRTLKPAMDDQSFDMDAVCKSARAGHQQLRYALSRMFFHVGATYWNRAPIGHMLNEVDAKLRKNANQKALSEAAGTDPLYDVFDIASVMQMFVDLHDLIESDRYRKKWRWGRFRLLNEFATDYFARRKREIELSSASKSLEVVIKAHELRRIKNIDSLVRTILPDVEKVLTWFS